MGCMEEENGEDRSDINNLQAEHEGNPHIYYNATAFLPGVSQVCKAKKRGLRQGDICEVHEIFENQLREIVAEVTCPEAPLPEGYWTLKVDALSKLVQL